MKKPQHASARKEMARHLSATLREARHQAQLTQADVAERVGVATEVYGRMERGHLMPSLLNLRALCEVLRLDADAALGLTVAEMPARDKGHPPAVEEPPRLRRLLRTLRQLDDQQLAAIGSVARGYVSSAKSLETPSLTWGNDCRPSPAACAGRPGAPGTNPGAGG
jgi:transcriptional regulator with XRE-family HTH domain